MQPEDNKDSLLADPNEPLVLDLENTEVIDNREQNEEVTQQILEAMRMAPLLRRLHDDYQRAKDARAPKERQWKKNLKAYRAEDSHTSSKNGGPSEFRGSENFKPYIRTTTVKTRSAYSQIMESLLQNSRFPLMIEPTPKPRGVPEHVTNDPAAQALDSQTDFGLGYEGDGKQLAPGAMATDPGTMWQESYPGMYEGTSTSPEYAQLSPAAEAAREVNKIILDQLEESNANQKLRKTVFECCLLGTGLMKGVFTGTKTQHRWVDGVYTPEEYRCPKIGHTSVWDLYVDPNALEDIDEAEFAIERHRMIAKQLREMKKQPGFRADAVERLISKGSNYEDASHEAQIQSTDAGQEDISRLWEVLEYWGYISKEEAIAAGLVDPMYEDDIIQVNIWFADQEILRIEVNPFIPQRIPYFKVEYEKDPYSFYGVGVPETMEDTQMMINGFIRQAVDNLALAGNGVFMVDETAVHDQNFDIFPGKVFRVTPTGTNNPIQAFNIPSTAQENMLMVQQMRQYADEATGIPSVSHGQTGVSGVGRTSSGLNMLLENASLNIKTVIRNIDDDLLQPLGRMLFFWNQQYNSEAMPKFTDLECVATGIRSYTKQEVKVQRLQTLLQLSQNTAIAPMVNIPSVMRELLGSMDLNPDEFINNIDEAMMAATIMGTAGGIQGGSTGQPMDPNAGAPQQQGISGLQGTGAGNPEGVNGQ